MRTPALEGEVLAMKVEGSMRQSRVLKAGGVREVTTSATDEDDGRAGRATSRNGEAGGGTHCRGGRCLPTARAMQRPRREPGGVGPGQAACLVPAGTNNVSGPGVGTGLGVGCGWRPGLGLREGTSQGGEWVWAGHWGQRGDSEGEGSGWWEGCGMGSGIGMHDWDSMGGD
jgi:hypothetical protein